MEPSGQSTPESHDSRESRDSRLGSRTRRTAPVVLTGLVQVAQRYRRGQQSLDFSMGGRSGGRNQSIEEEMKHYERSVIPPRKSTDLVGYWALYFILSSPAVC